MKANTRLFGEIEIEQEKLIKFEQGIIGFPDLKHFALIFDEEKGSDSAIKWLQSMEEPGFAMPVIDPYSMAEDYKPTVSDEIYQTIGELEDCNTFVLVTMTVPKDIEQMSINLKAPFVINMDTNKACQVIVEDDYPVKYKIYEKLKKNKEKAGE